MVQSVPENKYVLDDERYCVSVFNGKTDLARLNPRHKGAGDLTECLVNDKKYLKEIAENLGMKASKHY